MSKLDGARILITGGAGSLGTAIVERILTGTAGNPESITVFSRDEGKHHEMRLKYGKYGGIRFVIGDVRDYNAVLGAISQADIVIHTAALKHVRSANEYPVEAIKTNIHGAINIVDAIRYHNLKVNTVVQISSDKGVEPSNAYGMTKKLEEMVFFQKGYCPNTRFVAVCYGNVMASNGSVIPLFKQKIAKGEALQVRDPNMTRFLISLPQAVDTVLSVIETGNPFEIYIPEGLPATKISDLAEVMVDGRDIPIEITEPDTGEKTHEILVSGPEALRTIRRNGYFVVTPQTQRYPALTGEYSSKDYLISKSELRDLLCELNLMDKEKVSA